MLYYHTILEIKMSLLKYQKSCVQKLHKYVGTEQEGSDAMSSSIATTGDRGKTLVTTII